MTCDQCQEQFSEYLEETLPAQERQQVAAHLCSCPDCARGFAVFRRSVGALRDLEQVPPPPDLLARIQRAVAAETVPRRRLSWQYLGATAAAAALVVGFVMIFSHHHIGPIRTDVGPPPPVLEKAGGQVELAEPAAQLPPTSREEKATTAPAAVKPDSASTEAEAGQRRPQPSSISAASQPPAPSTPEAGKALPAVGSAGGDTGPGGPGAQSEREAIARGPGAPSPTGGVDEHQPLGAGLYGSSVTPAAARVGGGVKVVVTPAPLTERTVGQPVKVRVTLQPRVGVEHAVVRVDPKGELQLTSGAIIYQGPLSADAPKELSFDVVATTPGTQQLQVHLSSELAAVSAALMVDIPGFEPPLEHVTTQVFEKMPLDQAICAVAEEAGLQVEVGEGLGEKLVTHDFSEGVPGEAALRILAEVGGAKLQRTDAVYRIYLPSGDDG